MHTAQHTSDETTRIDALVKRYTPLPVLESAISLLDPGVARDALEELKTKPDESYVFDLTDNPEYLRGMAEVITYAYCPFDILQKEDVALYILRHAAAQ